MQTTYLVIEKTYLSDSNARISYGIAAYTEDSMGGNSTLVATLHDITTDQKALSELVDRCNELKLSPIHLHDIVEDFLES